MFDSGHNHRVGQHCWRMAAVGWSEFQQPGLLRHAALGGMVSGKQDRRLAVVAAQSGRVLPHVPPGQSHRAAVVSTC